MISLALIFAGAAVPVVSAYALGSRITRGEALPASLRLLLGLALLSQIYLAAFLLGFGNRGVFAIVAAALLALGGLDRPQWPKPAWGLAATLPFVAFYAIHALTPETTPDGVTYHLGLVREWVRMGAIGPRVGHFEIMPHGLEVLFAAAYAFGKHSAAKLVSFAITLAMIPVLLAAARRLDAPGWPAVLLVLCSPVAGIAGTSSYVDVALAAFALATFFLAWEQRDQLAAVAAGFCYAIKMTGGVVTGAAALYFAWRRNWRALAICVAMTLPWVARAAVLSGNPVAPLFTSLFPSEHFHPNAEAGLTEFVLSYGVPAGRLFQEVTIGGSMTAGFVGPAFLLAPLALLAVRRPAGRWVLAAAMVAGAPFAANHGTRFLIPALPFLALALVMALPARLAWLLAIAQAVLCWPPVLDLWAKPDAWRLRGLPWQAALRIEDEASFLGGELAQFAAADMVSRHTKPGERVLDIATIAAAYTDASIATHWQYTDADRAADALHLASRMDHEVFYELVAEPRGRMSAVRVEQTRAGPGVWSVQEVTLYRGGERVFPSQRWEVDARPNPWEAPLAFDRNPASRWYTRARSEAGQYLEVRFPAPAQADRVAVLLYAGEEQSQPRILVAGPDGGWRPLEAHRARWTALSLRRRAVSLARREGFRFIAVQDARDTFWGKLGSDLVEYPRDWGLEKVDAVGGVHLLRIP